MWIFTCFCNSISITLAVIKTNKTISNFITLKPMILNGSSTKTLETFLQILHTMTPKQKNQASF